MNIDAAPTTDLRTTNYGGATASCWINFPHADGSEVLARYFIKCAGWEPGNLEETYWFEKSDSDYNSEFTPYVLEAEEKGFSILFHVWPNEEK